MSELDLENQKSFHFEILHKLSPNISKIFSTAAFPFRCTLCVLRIFKSTRVPINTVKIDSGDGLDLNMGKRLNILEMAKSCPLDALRSS